MVAMREELKEQINLFKDNVKKQKADWEVRREGEEEGGEEEGG
jgi:hypothetical protein